MRSTSGARALHCRRQGSVELSDAGSSELELERTRHAMIGGVKYMLLGVIALAAVVVVPIGAQSPPPVDADQTRWWGHVKTLADDSLEGRQTGSDGYRKAASYVAEQFEQAGLKPAGTRRATCRASQFMRRRIVEDAVPCRARAWRHGRRAPVWRRTSRSTCARSWRPTSTRRWCSPATDSRRQTPGTTISPGLDLKGKVVVFINGTPAEHHRRAGGALSAGWAVRWQALKAAGAIGALADPQPEDDGAAVGTDGAEPPESGDDARRSALQRPRGNASSAPTSTRPAPSGCSRDPAARSRTCSRLPPSEKPLPRFALPASLRARVTLESTPIAVRQRRRAAAGQRSRAGPRARRADRPPRSRRRRRRGQRRSHLQRRHGQCLGDRDADRSGAARWPRRRRGRSGPCCSWR